MILQESGRPIEIEYPIQFPSHGSNDNITVTAQEIILGLSQVLSQEEDEQKQE